MALSKSEFTIRWSSFKTDDQHTIASCLAIKHGLKKSQVQVLISAFGITDPLFVLGKNETGSYARLAGNKNENQVLTLLLKSYL